MAHRGLGPADLYDAVHDADGKDYVCEAQRILDVVASQVPEARSLLDVACGTGRHLEQWSVHLRCTGIDVDEGMLAVARRRCPGVRFSVGDMVDFDLGERFDVVTCLFSSIAYTATQDRLDAAVASMARCLRPGGILVVEPWFQPERWSEGFVSLTTVDRPDLKMARVSRSGRAGNMALMDFAYVVATPDGIEQHHEHHELALFTWDDYRSAFVRAGLTVDIDERGLIGRGLVVGRSKEPVTTGS
jgi:SAM-dependent methyltransferase